MYGIPIKCVVHCPLILDLYSALLILAARPLTHTFPRAVTHPVHYPKKDPHCVQPREVGGYTQIIIPVDK